MNLWAGASIVLGLVALAWATWPWGAIVLIPAAIWLWRRS